MESTNNKSRTLSRCREWERQRRIKFNEAVSKLGDIVKEISKTTNGTSKETDNVQYPKVEIVNKAVIYLGNLVQEKTQLKAEILALQVKLDLFKKVEKKDASTQVFLSLGRKCQYDKQMKLIMLQKSKRNALKEKCVLNTNQKVMSGDAKQTSTPILPKLLPRSQFNNDKKPPENTIVVLPATPYIFPQRPLLFPTVPPAIVLVDSNLQALNKVSGSIVNRNSADVTKTTMVNILPISAYSRPMSATKVKKTVKSKKENKKTHKTEKKNSEKSSVPTENINKNNDTNTNKGEESSDVAPLQLVSNSTDKSNEEIKENNVKETSVIENIDINSKNVSSPNKSSETQNTSTRLAINKKEKISVVDTTNEILQNNQNNVNEVPTTEAASISETNTLTASSTTDIRTSNVIDNENSVLNKFNKISTQKEPITTDKEKENKLSNILDTTLCDATVDGGNARLELAEEFLAASPTAAFLMSFPLVSGNRADSPAEEPQNAIQTITSKDTRRNEGSSHTPNQFFDKVINDSKLKSNNKLQTTTETLRKHNESQKYIENHMIQKQTQNKVTNVITNSTHTSENPFLNLPMSSLISTNSAVPDSSFGLDYECNISKSMQNQSSGYASNSNLFYKSDPFNTVKNSIYSTSSITTSHDFNNLALYPCAMEKYASKNKSDYPNVEDNLMKIGSSRLTYDIDLGWSHKSFDFVNCTTSSNTFNKDSIITSVSAPYTTTYNPFNPEFHVPLVSSSNKKDNITNKTNTSFADTITNFYSQPTNLWSEDAPFYTNNTNSVAKTATTKHQNYLNIETPATTIAKPIDKNYIVNAKQSSDTTASNAMKPSNVSVEPQIPEKYTKKSPSKMHINWMTSEIRHMDSNCNPVSVEAKEGNKSSYPQTNNIKKQDHNESYFPISMHNFVTQPTQEEFQMWPSARGVGPTEITIEPPPINLPTLVGDLALGPHDKKKNSDLLSRPLPQTQDLQNCSNFLSVTQLMNRSSDNMTSRYHTPNVDTAKPVTKQNTNYFSNDINRKTVPSRADSQLPQPCYGFNESKSLNTYESMNQFSHNKIKSNKSDKTSKSQKNSYSAEALIRGGSCTQKIQEISSEKFGMTSQKYNEYNTSQDSSIAQVSHFPPIIDYSDNSYTSQQFSGTTLYNTTTNTISNSFYSNFMPGSSNLMSSNYTSAPFSGEFIDYSQTECNYTNHKYEELKMRNNPNAFPQDKVPSNYKSSRRESATKHKLECSKKETNKKYQSKRAKLNNEVEEWGDTSHPLLWQNKTTSKRHSNVISEELTFPNYVGNQMPTQYQPEFFNSHLMPSNVQSVGHNVDRSLSFPVTSRANFNLSTIFPEITMKVQ